MEGEKDANAAAATGEVASVEEGDEWKVAMSMEEEKERKGVPEETAVATEAGTVVSVDASGTDACIAGDSSVAGLF